MPTPRSESLRLSSASARAISRRTSALARLLTSFAAEPRPRLSPARVAMAPPIDDLRGEDADRECDADDDERAWPAGAALLRGRLHLCRTVGELRARGRLRRLARRKVRRRLSFDALLDQGGLQLTEKDGVIRQLVGDLRLDSALAGEALGRRLGLVGKCVERAHRFAGGASPVASRQIEVAARREATVAAAPAPA